MRDHRTHTRYAIEGILRDPEAKNNADDAAVDILVRMHAHHRHTSRVQQAKDAALGWVRANVPGMSDPDTPEVCVEAAAWLCCQLDANGIGGPYGAGFASDHGDAQTVRFPAFCQCGSGRRYASDGEAWTAAITSAAHAFDGDGRRFRVVPNMPFGIGVDCGDALRTSTNVSDLPDEWVAAYARGRAWDELDRWHFNGELFPDPDEHLDMARRWAEVAAWAEERAKVVEKICETCGAEFVINAPDEGEKLCQKCLADAALAHYRKVVCTVCGRTKVLKGEPEELALVNENEFVCGDYLCRPKK